MNNVVSAVSLLKGDLLAATDTSRAVGGSVPSAGAYGDPFKNFFENALESLEGVSAMESRADTLVQQYIAGEVDMPEVMVAMAKANLAVQFAVTTVTSVVNTFKEMTQMQI